MDQPPDIGPTGRPPAPTPTAPAGVAPVHPKVRNAALASLVSSLVLAVLVWTTSPDLMAGLPTWAQGVLIALAPPLITLVTGYRTASGSWPA